MFNWNFDLLMICGCGPSSRFQSVSSKPRGVTRIFRPRRQWLWNTTEVADGNWRHAVRSPSFQFSETPPPLIPTGSSTCACSTRPLSRARRSTQGFFVHPQWRLAYNSRLSPTCICKRRRGWEPDQLCILHRRTPVLGNNEETTASSFTILVTPLKPHGGFHSALVGNLDLFLTLIAFTLALSYLLQSVPYLLMYFL